MRHVFENFQRDGHAAVNGYLAISNGMIDGQSFAGDVAGDITGPGYKGGYAGTFTGGFAGDSTALMGSMEVGRTTGNGIPTLFGNFTARAHAD